MPLIIKLKKKVPKDEWREYLYSLMQASCPNNDYEIIVEKAEFPPEGTIPPGNALKAEIKTDSIAAMLAWTDIQNYLAERSDEQ